jgi:hypothetical protein
LVVNSDSIAAASFVVGRLGFTVGSGKWAILPSLGSRQSNVTLTSRANVKTRFRNKAQTSDKVWRVRLGRVRYLCIGV